MPRVKITAKMLWEKDACPPLIEEFEEQWPDGLYVTKKNCLAVARWDEMSLYWAARALLHRKQKFLSMVLEVEEVWLDERASREALAQADAHAFWTLAKGILR